MQFPDRDAMTPEQAADNSRARTHLVRGKYYHFNPPVTATAIPVGGPGVCTPEDCIFDRGWYIGFVNQNHIFQGKPVDDQRVIMTPQGHEGTPNMDQLRASYFPVLFVGGSEAVLDVNQNHY